MPMNFLRAFFVFQTLLILGAAAMTQSIHLFFGGLVMALMTAIFYVVTKGAQKKTQEDDAC